MNCNQVRLMNILVNVLDCNLKCLYPAIMNSSSLEFDSPSENFQNFIEKSLDSLLSSKGLYI